MIEGHVHHQKILCLYREWICVIVSSVDLCCTVLKKFVDICKNLYGFKIECSVLGNKTNTKRYTCLLHFPSNSLLPTLHKFAHYHVKLCATYAKAVRTRGRHKASETSHNSRATQRMLCEHLYTLHERTGKSTTCHDVAVPATCKHSSKHGRGECFQCCVFCVYIVIRDCKFGLKYTKTASVFKMCFKPVLSNLHVCMR